MLSSTDWSQFEFQRISTRTKSLPVGKDKLIYPKYSHNIAQINSAYLKFDLSDQPNPASVAFQFAPIVRSLNRSSLVLNRMPTPSFQLNPKKGSITCFQTSGVTNSNKDQIKSSLGPSIILPTCFTCSGAGASTTI